MTAQLPILAVLWPLLAGVLCALLPNRRGLLTLWGGANLLCCNLVAMGLVTTLLNTTDRVMRYRLSGWAPPMGIELKVTVLSAFLSWLIFTVALVAFLGGRYTWDKQIGHRLPHYLALMFLLVASFQGLALSNDAFNLYVMLEISSLATYGLIAMGGGRAYLATFQYIVMGTIGASFYLIGVGYLYIKTGTLNIDDLALRLIGLGDLAELETIGIGLAFLVVGLLLKMGAFPLHYWLPNAYTYAPDATSSVVAPLSTKLAVFLMFRVLYDIFGGSVSTDHPLWSTFVVTLASIGIVAGTALAMAQRDLKKIFACLIVAEAGYMLGGLWLSDSRGAVGALFHLVNDAVATLVLMLLVIACQSSRGERNLKNLTGLFKASPVTSAALVLIAFNLIGVPPSAGFFSKVTLITGAIASSQPIFVIALLLASLGNLAIFFRIIEIAYFHPSEDKPEPVSKDHEQIGALAFLMALSLFALGMLSQSVMQNFIVPVVSQ